MLDNPPGFPLWELSSLVFFAIPMVVMIVLYARMGLQIRFRSKHASVLGKSSFYIIWCKFSLHWPGWRYLFSVIIHREYLLELRIFDVELIFCMFLFFSRILTGVQQGSMHNETKQVQSRKAIIRMLGKWTKIRWIYDKVRAIFQVFKCYLLNKFKFHCTQNSIIDLTHCFRCVRVCKCIMCCMSSWQIFHPWIYCWNFSTEISSKIYGMKLFIIRRKFPNSSYLTFVWLVRGRESLR